MSKIVKFELNVAQDVVQGLKKGFIQNKRGEQVNILYFKARGPKPIIGLVEIAGIDYPYAYDKRGVLNGTDDDLVINLWSD